jgi:hypothetical protein
MSAPWLKKFFITAENQSDVISGQVIDPQLQELSTPTAQYTPRGSQVSNPWDAWPDTMRTFSQISLSEALSVPVQVLDNAQQFWS